MWGTGYRNSRRRIRRRSVAVTRAGEWAEKGGRGRENWGSGSGVQKRVCFLSRRSFIVGYIGGQTGATSRVKVATPTDE